jgi:hypothetical protein
LDLFIAPPPLTDPSSRVLFRPADGFEVPLVSTPRLVMLRYLAYILIAGYYA